MKQLLVGWIGIGLVVTLALTAGPAAAVEDHRQALPGEAADHLTTEASAAPSLAGLDEELAGEPMRISMDFKDADLKTVLKTFSRQTGINVIASDEVGRRTVTLFLEDVTVMDALDRILSAAGLVYERPPGSQIYVVKPKPAEEGEAGVATITRVYRLKFARVSTSRLARAAEALGSQTPFEASQATSAAISATSGGTSGGTGTTTGGLGGGLSSAGGGGKEIGVDKVVEKLLTADGKVMVDERTNSLVVTDVPSNFARIESVLKSLDIRTAQILIEAEVLETTLGKSKDLGIEWGGSTTTAGQLATFTPNQRKTRFPFGALGEAAPVFISGTDTPNFGLSTLSAADFKGSLQALEQDTDTKILARPKILTLDNESALIRLSSQQAVGFTNTSVAQTSTTTAATERITTGVILVVTPQVNEGGFITMLVEPSVTKTVLSSLSPPSSLGTKVLDPKTRSARAMVRIRQGDTLVLGG
ncbi:MAG: hypothetical protein HYS71_01315, partial [Candidatus Omnitrophica bacterium]|nr:hypothetical protein [Candidatus Omnitrophota bacterium]